MKRTLISLVSLMMVLTLAVSVAESTDTATLTDAQTAYATAKQSTTLTDYEAELKTMVENGSLTQEQADLLLTAAKESVALRSGVCPSCGYEFQTTSRKGGNVRGMGNRGMNRNGSVTTDASDATDLEQAQTAYATAKQASRMTDYEAELTAMVAAGTLTQEQADLLLTSAKETEALANGTCPSCGYTFQTGTGRTAGYGMQNNGMQNNGMKNGNGRGGRR